MQHVRGAEPKVKRPYAGLNLVTESESIISLLAPASNPLCTDYELNGEPVRNHMLHIKDFKTKATCTL